MLRFLSIAWYNFVIDKDLRSPYHDDAMSKEESLRQIQAIKAQYGTS